MEDIRVGRHLDASFRRELYSIRMRIEEGTQMAE